MSFKWEIIDSYSVPGGGNHTRRAKVHGGWVLKHCDYDNDYQAQSESMVFIPDPKHEWTV